MGTRIGYEKLRAKEVIKYGGEEGYKAELRRRASRGGKAKVSKGRYGGNVRLKKG
jgi:hypothetical protein